MSVDRLLEYIREGTDDRIYAISQLMGMGVDPSLICNRTQIDMFLPWTPAPRSAKRGD